MIAPEKIKPALRTIQEAILLARKRACEKEDRDKIAEILDDAEYLPALMLDSDDMTQRFREYVAEMAQRYSWALLLSRFDEEEGTCC